MLCVEVVVWLLAAALARYVWIIHLLPKRMSGQCYARVHDFVLRLILQAHVLSGRGRDGGYVLNVHEARRDAPYHRQAR